MCMGGGGGKQEASQAEIQMYQTAQAEMGYWKKNFKGLEDKAMLDAKKQVFSDTRRGEVRGKAHVAAISQLNKRTGKQLDPNSGAGKQQELVRRAATGDALATASTAAEASTRSQGYGGMVQMAKFGRGQQQVAYQGMSTTARLGAGNEAANAALAKNASDFNAEMAGSIVGMGISGFSGAGKPDTFTLNDTSFSAGDNGVIYNERTGMGMDLGRRGS